MSSGPRSDRSQKQAAVRRFSRNVASLRRRAGFAQDEAVARAGLHRTQISLLERGLRVSRLDTIVQLAGALDAEPCELLKGMAWRLDCSRYWGPEKAGNLELKIGPRWEEV